MADFVLYGTAGCHLCEDAEALLAKLSDTSSRTIELIDIAEDDRLIERYGVRIPVLLACRDNAELGWPFDAAAAAVWLRQHGPGGVCATSENPGATAET